MGKSFMVLIRRFLWLCLGVLLVVFAVNNRGAIPLSFEPFGLSFSIPIYLVLFAGIFLGLFISAFVTGWLRLESFTKRRKAERRADYLGEQMSSMAEDAYKTRSDRAHETAKTGGDMLAKTD